MPLYTNTQCSKAGWSTSGWQDDDENGNPAKVIYFYIEKNFAAQLADCTSYAFDDTELSEAFVRSVVKDAAEVWNLSSRGIALKYGGWVDREEYTEACTQQMFKRPAVFVNFKDGCREIGGNCTNSFAWTYNDSTTGCEDSAWLNIYGDTNTKVDDTTDPDVDGTDCDGSNGGILEWRTGTVSAENDLMAILVHEFGHVLNLGHPSAPPDSVMRSANDNNDQRNRQLFYWEKDCVDDSATNNGRDFLEYSWLGFNSSGTQITGVQNRYTNLTDRGMLSGGHFRYSAVGEYYFLYYGDLLRYGSPALGDGAIHYAATTSLASVHYRDETPVFFTLRESALSSDYQRMNYLDAASTSLIDPPDVNYRRSSNLFSSYGWATYDMCVSGCSSTRVWFG